VETGVVNWNSIIYLLVIALFLLSVGLALWSRDQSPGIALILCGALAILFSRSLSKAQENIAKRRIGPIHLRNVRPLTFVLWGIGILIVGTFWMFSR
jgi:hypothetical protein